MRKAAKQILICAALLALLCAVSRFLFFDGYTVYIPLSERTEETLRREGVRFVQERPETLRVAETELQPGVLRLRVHPRQQGDGEVDIVDPDGESLLFCPLRVGRFHTVYDMSSGGFTGDTAVLIAVTLFWLLVSAIMLWHYFQARGAAFYAYATIYYVGFSLFSLVSGVEMLSVTVQHLASPSEFSMLAAYRSIYYASTRMMQLTTPLILAFAVAMAVSNIALLRHARPQLQNALGLLVSFLLIAGEAFGWYLFSRDFMGSEWEGRVRSTIDNTYATVFVYFECMLAGSVVCGVQAARRRPAMDKDFIIVLGCWFRPDGTLPPLLRGRVDGAIAFWRRQQEETGKTARFIPSGGRGRDEPMPEADAMRAYLLAQGVPDSLILPENRSQNTYQNMAFSREIMQKTLPEGKAVFATTNYHVFRSGVWAAQAGLSAEGVGSKTRWWFWPNAFMRETAGLLLKRWKQEILFLLLLIVFFGLLSLML